MHFHRSVESSIFRACFHKRRQAVRFTNLSPGLAGLCEIACPWAVKISDSGAAARESGVVSEKLSCWSDPYQHQPAIAARYRAPSDGRLPLVRLKPCLLSGSLATRSFQDVQKSRKIMYLHQFNGSTKATTVFDWLAHGSLSPRWSLTTELDRQSRSWWVKPQLPSWPRWRKTGQSGGHYKGDLSARKRKAEFGEAYLPKARWIMFQPKRTWPRTQARASAQITIGQIDREYECSTQLFANGIVENFRRKVAFRGTARESKSGAKNVSALGFLAARCREMSQVTAPPAKRSRQTKLQTFDKGCGTSSCTCKGSSSEREWRRPR